MNDSILNRAQNDRGVSLIVVLWIMSILIMIVFEFVYTMRVEGSAVRNFQDEVSAYYLAIAGINIGLSEIAGKYKFVGLGADGQLLFLTKDAGEVKPIEFKREFNLGQGVVSYTLQDERGKLNINTAKREMIVSLLRDTGVEESERDVIADSVLDWRDPNKEFHRLNGAKDDYYQTLPQPYNAKNGPFDTSEELLLVRGMNPEMFYGIGKVPPQFGLPRNLPDQTLHAYTGMMDFLTVRGDDKININTADEKVLRAVLGEGRAQEVLLRRTTVGYYELPVYGGIVSSNSFSIYSKGDIRGIRVGLHAIVERQPGTAEFLIKYWNEEGISSD
ncbi:MAG: general secretion pathway protein GspK [Nitrospiria bacterium]